jgi:natural product biosynthesis luciferase-like monooxygenase protein
MNTHHAFSCFIVGTGPLPVRCAELLLERGHQLRGMITSDPVVADWAAGYGIRCLEARAYDAALRQAPFDYLFSIGNLSVLPQEVLRLPRRGAINFHDGPLPRYGGLYAPNWALINQERMHGITWHLMTEQVDGGDILQQRHFEVAEDEAAWTLNARCFEAGVASFQELMADLSRGRLAGKRQVLEEASYGSRWKRPAAACTLSWDQPAAALAALVRALDFGPSHNPLGLAKFVAGDEVFAVTRARPLPGRAALPGTVIAVEEEWLRVATGAGELLLSAFLTLEGRPISAREVLARAGLEEGGRLPALAPARAERLTLLYGAACRHESFWVKRLASARAPSLPYLRHAPPGLAPATYASRTLRLPESVPPAVVRLAGGSRSDFLVAAFAAYLTRLAGKEPFDLGFCDPALGRAVKGVDGWFAGMVPLRVELEEGLPGREALRSVGEEIARLRDRVSYSRDLVARAPELRSGTAWSPAIVVEQGEEGEGGEGGHGEALRVRFTERGAECRWLYRSDAIDAGDVERMQGQFALFLSALAADPERALWALPLLGEEERRRVLVEWNATQREIPEGVCIHERIEAQVERTPDAVALICQGVELTYRALNERANRVAYQLRSLGVGPDVLVGLCVERSLEMVVALLAVHKAGGAYVPLDPTYPAERLAFMLEDSCAPVLLVQERLREKLPAYGGRILSLEAAERDAPGDARSNPESGVRPGDLAYVIYTSGSTGRPKGVMVEHRNAINFFAGVEERIGGREPGVWLAVTSLSFDISVLELLWTLTRGYTVVIYTGEERSAAPASGAWVHRGIDFSLFYFSGDGSREGGDKYRLLLDGARFADHHGFSAVWTPERHFHAFGGLYPNPSVTGAALAAITDRIQIRAGSVVIPLHHPVRVAEEWAVVDNLSGGRVGISFASGWQPNDFLLRPENYAEAKRVMARDLETVRRLWRGESVTLENPLGKPTEIRTLPRPVQPELPFWLTAAGSPATFELAGTIGARVLTHLLGQSVEELASKLAVYRRAWKTAGHPGDGYVSLMLHTFVGDDEAAVREAVRGPMIDYLRTATNLVKSYAWAFPAFKSRGRGQGSADDLDFQSLTDAEMEALLAFSFERYYQTSGLFGTPESCRAMVERLKAIGVDEIACLVDFGVDPETVLAHLEHLDRLRQRTSSPAAAASDHSIPALIARHRVTHLQCTPSMARMLLADGRARDTLRLLRYVLIGGEAFPPSLASELRAQVAGEILNMYGPTETTVWSTTHRLARDIPETAIPIGRPIANTELYIVDPHGQPVPVGVEGELLIGGSGVVRGYLRRPDLSAARFTPNPFNPGPGARLYHTGDRARYRPDGTVDFLGRLDHQVKIRGHRIELGEVEAVLASHPAVREAVVVVREDTPGDPRVVAYLVPHPGESAPAAALRAHLRAKLPEFMVPTHFVALAKLPRTPNAKIDRKALPAPNETAPAGEAQVPEEGEPHGELERVIAQIWKDVLKVPRVEVHDNFFDLGGHSLLAIQVHTRLCKALGREISIADYFQFPTVGTLARYLARGEEAVGGALRSSSTTRHPGD